MSDCRQRAVEAPELIPHGTIGGYTNWGCKCDRCLDAWAAYIERYRREHGIGRDGRKRP